MDEIRNMNSHFLLRRFSHPWMPTLFYIPISVILIMFSVSYQQRNFLSIFLFSLLGLFSWTLLEYFLHRFVFHWTQVKEPWKSLASGLHMAHHRSADEKDLIIAPPLVSVVFGSLVYLLFAALLQSWSLAALIEAGLLIGYVIYEWIHYGAHRFRPKSRVGKYLQQYHLRHHYKKPNGIFGVTSPLWDYVFRSY